jgi:hypothetical protein
MDNSFKYQHLAQQNSDYIRLQESYSKRNEPWYFINMLPTTLQLYLKRDGKINFLTEMKQNQTLKLQHDLFRDYDKIYTYYKLNNGKLISFLPTHRLFLNSKTVKFGAVTYSSEDGRDGGSQNGFYDIKGIWINNKLPFPIDMYYKGNLVVQFYGNKGLDYMGGGASEIYFNNGGDGLNYLDTLEFRYSMPDNSKFLFKVIIDDVYCKKMFIGDVSSTPDAPFPDNSVYRLQEPNYTALTYFLPIGGGQSMMTNPTSPFYS